MKTRACGHMHPDGLPCLKPVFYENGCCIEKVYEHEGPHEHVNKDGIVVRRWEEILQIVDLPFNAYGPMSDEELKDPEKVAVS